VPVSVVGLVQVPGVPDGLVVCPRGQSRPTDFAISQKLLIWSDPALGVAALWVLRVL